MPILKNDLSNHLIKPLFSGSEREEFLACLQFFEKLLKILLPDECLALQNATKEEAHYQLLSLDKKLPLITWNENISSLSSSFKASIGATFLGPASFTEGAGRYFLDSLSRWLNPGKFLGISYAHSLDFQFKSSSQHTYFISHVIVDVASEKELVIIKNNMDLLIQEITLNLLAVKSARQIVATKGLTEEERKMIIQDNINSLLNRPSKNFDLNLYDQMHHLLNKLKADEMTKQLNETLAHSLEKVPSIYNRDVFNEIQHFTLLFREKFTAKHNLKTIARIISHHYLFHKSLASQISQDPNLRYLHLKLFTFGTNSLSILVGLNMLNENELFSKRHMIQAIESSLPSIKIGEIKDSFISDYRVDDKVKLFYLEIEKIEGESFTRNEIKILKKNLPGELQNHFEQILHPVFMPRNEEEIMRSIVLLSQQLKYPNDIPQCVISFEAQNNQELLFTVAFVRVCKGTPLKERMLLLDSPLKFEEWETKPIGSLRKQWVKEANVFKVKINKSLFLRRDYKVDLFKARHFVASSLKQLFGEFRDYNGGILSKQHEIFLELLHSCGDAGTNYDFLLENFFFSLHPPLMRSLLPLNLLRSFSKLLIEAFEGPKESSFFYEEEDYLLTISRGTSVSFTDEILVKIDQLNIASSDLTTSAFSANGINFVGFAFHSHDKIRRSLFLDLIK